MGFQKNQGLKVPVMEEAMCRHDIASLCYKLVHVGQLADGGCLELATAYRKVARDLPRDNH